MRKNAIFLWAKRRYKLLLAVLAIAIIAGLLVFININSLMPGPNHYEAEALKRLAAFDAPWTNPLNYPYFLLAKFYSLFLSPLTALRVASGTFGIATIALLSYCLRQWFNDRVAVAGTLLIVTSSWFLALSRIGAPFILSSFWLTLLLALGTWRTYTTKPVIVDTIIAITVAFSLYTPYFIWLVVIGIIVLALRRKQQLFLLPRRHQWILPLVVVVLLAPLIYACVQHIAFAKALLGISVLPSSLAEYSRQLGQNIFQLFFRGFLNPALNLGRLPLLDIFSVVMVAMGAYYFERRLSLRRSQILFSLCLIIGLSISITPFDLGKLAILFPLVMIFVIGGIVELLDRWLGSFPHNPIARSVGVCVMVVAIGFTSYYHLQRYFVAWANNPDVIAEHQRSQ